MTNPYTNTRGSITPLQVSKQAPDLMLHSSDDIQNTMYSMKKKGLLHEVEAQPLHKLQKYNDYGTGTLESEKERDSISNFN